MRGSRENGTPNGKVQNCGHGIAYQTVNASDVLILYDAPFYLLTVYICVLVRRIMPVPTPYPSCVWLGEIKGDGGKNQRSEPACTMKIFTKASPPTTCLHASNYYSSRFSRKLSFLTILAHIAQNITCSTKA
jgi:hypothetical protein